MPVIIDGTLGVNAAAVTTTSWNPTNLVIPGNSTIGDASSDTLTVNATTNFVNKVGVNNSNPQYTLDVSGIAYIVPTSSNTNVLTIGSNSGYASNIDFYRSGYNHWFLGSPSNSTGFGIGEDGTHATNSIWLATGGNVGIGTNAPTERLHVANNAGGNVVVQIDANTESVANAGIVAISGSSYDAYFQGSSKQSGATTINGAIGIANNSGAPYIRLNVGGNAAAYEIARFQDKGLVIGDTAIGTRTRLKVSSGSYPETAEYLAEFVAGTANPYQNRYIKLRQSYTGSGYDGLGVVWENNADASNNKSYSMVRTRPDGSFLFSTRTAGSSIGAGTSLGTTSKLHIGSDDQFIVYGGRVYLGYDTTDATSVALRIGQNITYRFLEVLNGDSAGGIKTGGLLVSSSYSFGSPPRGEAMIESRLSVNTTLRSYAAVTAKALSDATSTCAFQAEGTTSGLGVDVNTIRTVDANSANWATANYWAYAHKLKDLNGNAIISALNDGSVKVGFNQGGTSGQVFHYPIGQKTVSSAWGNIALVKTAEVIIANPASSGSYNWYSTDVFGQPTSCYYLVQGDASHAQELWHCYVHCCKVSWVKINGVNTYGTYTFSSSTTNAGPYTFSWSGSSNVGSSNPITITQWRMLP